MTDYLPTTDEVRGSLVFLNKHYAEQRADVDVDLLVVESETAAQFDRWLAEVRRQAAEEALLKAADAFEGGEINIEIFGDSVEARLWRMSNQTRASLVKSLRARAATYRRERGEQ